MKINLSDEDNDTTIVQKQTNIIELKSKKGIDIISSIYMFKDDDRVVIIKKQNHKINTFMFKNQEQYLKFNFGNWASSKELYNSLTDNK